MKENNLKAKYIKPYIQTTVSHDFSNKLKNLLNRHYNPTRPNVACRTDITYIWTYDDGFVYLTSVMNLYSRSIISDEVLKCIKKAKERRNIENPLVIQSDRGVQYTQTKYRELTSEFIRSYSRKGTPWDKACIESFHSLIKREWLNFHKIQNNNHVYRLIFEYIEGFYNTVRIHSHCGYLSPTQFEQKYLFLSN